MRCSGLALTYLVARWFVLLVSPRVSQSTVSYFTVPPIGIALYALIRCVFTAGARLPASIPGIPGIVFIFALRLRLHVTRRVRAKP